MATAAKTAAVAEIRDAFRESSAAVLTEYRGLTVAQLKELRRALAGNATYAVVKNTLTKIAASDAGIAGFDALLEGPSAIAFVSGDPVTVAKGIRDFARTNPLLVIKGGVLDGRPLSADEVRRLADLESREVLLARLAGAMQASPAAAVSLLAAPLSQAARVLAALQAAAEADPTVLPGGADAPAAPATDQPAIEQPVTEKPATEEPTATASDAPVSVSDEPVTSTSDQPATYQPAPEERATDQPPAEERATDQPAGEEAAASGDAADAALAADALAREESPAVPEPGSAEVADPAPAETAPELPATQALEDPPA